MAETRKTPLVSVVIPTYNRAAVLGRSVRSVLGQTFSDLEVIVVDDRSTDDTGALLSAIGDPRLRHIRLPANQGAATARNIGVENARGPCIAFQDSDDVWLADKLEKQMALLRANGDNPAVVYSGFIRWNGVSARYVPEHTVQRREGNILPQLLKESLVSTQTMLLPRRCFVEIGGFDPELGRLQDWDLAIRLARHFDFLAVDEPLVIAHDMPENISSDITAFTEALARILERHRALFADHPDALARHLTFLGHCLCATGQIARGRGHLGQSLRVRRTSVRTWTVLLASLLGAGIYGKLARWRRPGVIG